MNKEIEIGDVIEVNTKEFIHVGINSLYAKQFFNEKLIFLGTSDFFYERFYSINNKRMYEIYWSWFQRKKEPETDFEWKKI